jgi:hypothetical protein
MFSTTGVWSPAATIWDIKDFLNSEELFNTPSSLFLFSMRKTLAWFPVPSSDKTL